MTSRILRARIALVLTAGLLAGPVYAQSSIAQRPGFTAELISGGSDPAETSTVWLGLDVHLDPGWHTYWRSSGDAGAPPEFDWTRSTNVASASVEWPAPNRFSEGGLDTFGYADHVIFPVRLQLRDPHAPTHVALKAQLYVCSTLCTSNQLTFDSDVPAGFHSAEIRSVIDSWRAKVPRDKSDSISIRSVGLQAGPQPHVRVDVSADPPLNEPDAFVDGDDAVLAHRPIVTRESDGAASIDVPLAALPPGHPNKPLRVTIVDGARSIEAALTSAEPGTTQPADTSTDARIASSSPWHVLGLSLLGGFILNFMPCVFPVLSLKVFSLVGTQIRSAQSIRIGFLASAAGVIGSFLLLAVALILLKAAGAQVGWGIQFQQPVFLIFMTAVLAALAANLLGLYELRLPWRLAGSLDRAASGPSISSYFVNGLVMTLLATPCSAPFVGGAVSYALSQGPAQILPIFLGLGAGMASPYIALALVPQVGRFLPRPGRWMLAVRYVAAAAMAGTAIWLLTILAQVSTPRIALLTGATAGIAVWAIAVLRQRFAHVIAAVLILGLSTVAALQASSRSELRADPSAAEVRWQPFSAEKVRSLVSGGNTVFIDIGAAWCVTCKVNEALVAASSPIEQRLKSDVVPIRADWTKTDPEIAAYLRSFGRYGLPFNAVFGPNAPNGIVLPELLTQKAVLDAFKAASNHTSD